MIWTVFLVTLLMVGNEGRTLDGGRGATRTFKPQHPMGRASLSPPVVKGAQEDGVMVGLNDIQDGRKEKGSSIDDSPAVPEVIVASTIAPPVREAEDNNIASVADTVENNDLEAEEETTPDELIEQESGESNTFDEDIFEGENDVIVIMRRMYESLTNRLNMLKSRVNSVEQTARDVLTRLTVMDCSDLMQGASPSGIYTLHMDHNGKRPVTVVCDMETDGGGWTVVQRRLPHSKAVNFDREWHDYKMGFGNATTDYWIGLENLYIWTNARHYELRIQLTDFEGESAYAQYDRFYVEGEEYGYRLHISGYSGTAGDSMTNGGKPDNFTADGMMFTTHDRDHDTSHEINCAKYWKIGGWWFNRCSWANLNGPYKEAGEGDGIGINWHMWRNKEYLRSSAIMIRPAKNL